MEKTPEAIKKKYGIEGLTTFRSVEASDTSLDTLRERNELWLEVRESGWEEKEIAQVAGVKLALVKEIIGERIEQMERTLDKIRPPKSPIKAKDLTPKEKVI